MNVEVWADVVCPWCYIGKRNLDAALEMFAYRDQVNVIWRSFELDPEVAADDERPIIEILVEKYGSSIEDVLANQARVTALGQQAGIVFALEKTRNVNSFDAHRMVQASAKFGLQSEFVERLYAAHFTEGLLLNDPAILRQCAVDVGIDGDQVDEILSTGAYAGDVRIAEATAQDLRVEGVPFYVIDRKFAVAGAQSPDVLLDVLQQCWDELGDASSD